MSESVSQAKGPTPAWKLLFERTDRMVGTFIELMSAGGAIASCFIMAMMTVDVIFRNFTGRSIPGAFELVEVALVLAIFLGMAGAERDKTHVRVTMLTGAVPKKVGNAMRNFGLLVSFGLVVWFSFMTFDRGMAAYQAGEYKTSLISFPLWPARLIIAYGFFLLAIELGLSIMRNLLNPRSSDTPSNTEGTL